MEVCVCVCALQNLFTIVQRVIFAFPEDSPAVMKLVIHSVNHRTENLSSGAPQLHAFQLQEVQR